MEAVQVQLPDKRREVAVLEVPAHTTPHPLSSQTLGLTRSKLRTGRDNNGGVRTPREHLRRKRGRVQDHHALPALRPRHKRRRRLVLEHEAELADKAGHIVLAVVHLAGASNNRAGQRLARAQALNRPGSGRPAPLQDSRLRWSFKVQGL